MYESIIPWLTTGVWLLALWLYYKMGKQHGYSKGYADGEIAGATEVLRILSKGTKT